MRMQLIDVHRIAPEVLVRGWTRYRLDRSLPADGMVCGCFHLFPAAGLRSTNCPECFALDQCCCPEPRRIGRFLFPQGMAPSVSCLKIHRHSRHQRPCFRPHRRRPRWRKRHNSIDRQCRTRMQVVSCINLRCNSSNSPCLLFYSRSTPKYRTSV